MNELILKARRVTGGRAEGPALVTAQALAGWGGIDPETGRVIDVTSELNGQNIQGRVLVFRGARGSSGWSEAFHAARLNGAGPAAMVFTEMTGKVAAGVVALRIPSMIYLESDLFTLVSSGDYVVVDADQGVVRVRKS